MRILVLLACCTLFITCGKNKGNELLGTWKLVEIYNVSQSWQAVSPAQQTMITFNSDNTYNNKPPLISSFSGCNGTYRIEPGNIVYMNLSCVPDPNYKDQLVFTRQGITLVLDHVATSAGVKTKYEKQ